MSRTARSLHSLVRCSLVFAAASFVGCGDPQLEAGMEYENPVPELASDLETIVQPLASESTRRSRTISIAAGEIGVNEDDDADRIDEYTKGRGGEWCSEFASWCLQKAGGSKMGYKYSWDAVWRWGRNNGRTRTRPIKGDLMVLDGHTAIVESAGSTSFTTIDGNWDDQVKRVTRSYSQSNLLGFVNPY
jgi:hypothetical protein